MHLVMLTEKAKDYDQALREQIGADSPTSDKLRRQLPSNIPANRRKALRLRKASSPDDAGRRGDLAVDLLC